MENGCAGWGCPPNRKLAVFGQFLVGGGGSKGEGSSERFPAGLPLLFCIACGLAPSVVDAFLHGSRVYFKMAAPTP